MAYHSFLTIILPAVFALISTVLAIKFIMPYFYNAGIIAADMNKEKVKKIPGSGGVTVAFGVTVGILAYTFGASFLFRQLSACGTYWQPRFRYCSSPQWDSSMT